MVNDVFDEVEVQMRAERARDAFAKAWPWLLALLVALLVAVGGWFAWRNWQHQQSEAASSSYQEAVAQAARGDTRGAEAAFTRASESGTPGYRALALMQRANLALDRNDTAAAVRLMDQARDIAPDPLMADAAGLQAAYALLDTAPLADIEARLAPLTVEGRPYRPLAREARAVALALNGRVADARREFVTLSLLDTSPDTLRTRAQANIQVLDGGGAPALRAIVQAARSVPAAAVQAYRAQQAQAQQAAQNAQMQAQAQAAAAAQGGGAPPPPGSAEPAPDSPGPAQ